MWLLAEVLGDHQAGHVKCGLAVLVHAAHHELGPVDVFPLAAGLVGALGECLDGGLVVVGGDQVVQHHAVGDLAGEFHHLHAGGTEVDRHVLRAALLVHVVEFHTVELHELAVHGDGLVREQAAHRGDDLAHRTQGLGPRDSDLGRQGVPPCADPEDDATGCQVIKRRERGCEAGRVACPAVDDARADLDRVGDRGERRHRHDGIAHESAVGLPHGLEPLLFGVLGVLHALGNGMGVLKVNGSRARHGVSSVWCRQSLSSDLGFIGNCVRHWPSAACRAAATAGAVGTSPISPTPLMP